MTKRALRTLWSAVLGAALVLTGMVAVTPAASAVENLNEDAYAYTNERLPTNTSASVGAFCNCDLFFQFTAQNSGSLESLRGITSTTATTVTLLSPDYFVPPTASTPAVDGAVIATASIPADGSGPGGSTPPSTWSNNNLLLAGQQYVLKVSPPVQGVLMGTALTGDELWWASPTGGSGTLYSSQTAHGLAIDVVVTRPVVAHLTPSTPNGDDGWYRTAPTISFTCAILASPCPASRSAAEGQNTIEETTSLGPAGPYPWTFTTKVDSVPPTLTATVAPLTEGTKAPLKVDWTCTDASSGVKSCPDDEIAADATAALALNRTATDEAGNSVTRSVAEFYTPPSEPVVTPKPTPKPNPKPDPSPKPKPKKKTFKVIGLSDLPKKNGVPVLDHLKRHSISVVPVKGGPKLTGTPSWLHSVKAKSARKPGKPTKVTDTFAKKNGRWTKKLTLAPKWAGEFRTFGVRAANGTTVYVTFYVK